MRPIIRTMHASTAIGVLAATAAVAQPTGPITTNGVTAHRGYSGAYVENTMQAFEEALELGVDWIELDIFTTADGRIVVTHDGSTLKLTGHDGRIGEMTYDEIAELDTAVDYRLRTGADEERMPPKTMPLLRDALELIMTQDRTRLSLQPKDGSTPAAIDMIREMGAEPWVGFNDGSLEKMSQVKEMAPEIPVFWDRWSVSRVDEHLEIAKDRGFESLVYNEQVITPEAIAKVRAAGLEFGVWTVNDTRAMRRLAEMGVDRLYTDHPDVALAIMGHDDRVGLERGLLSYWPFDAAEDGILANAGAPSPLRDAIAHGGAEIAQDGIADGALSLRGDGAYAEVPIEVLPDGVPQLTISAWVRPESVEGAQTIVGTTGTGASTGGEAVLLRLDGGKVSYSLATTGEHVAAATVDAPITAGEWHHVALSYDERTGETRVYVDGAPQEVAFSGFYETVRTSGTLDDTDAMYVGVAKPGPNVGDWFGGAIDELAVWRRVLSPSELEGIYNDGAARPIILSQL